ncbi:MAG: single-stranded DNA-binding protein [Lachnospiraceae bacterium]|nr:single-stranded DNA-binding protein [Lachnospiraceae bacterium]
MNKVILMGRLTRDPEVRYSQGASQTAVARFSIAVDRRFKREGEPEADFFNCTAFGRQAEFVEKYLHKGTKMLVTGRIQNDNYTNRDGQQVYSVRVMVDELEFAESKNASGGGNGGYDSGYNNGGFNNSGFNNNGGYGASNGNTGSSPLNDGFMNIPDGIDEELPFA